MSEDAQAPGQAYGVGGLGTQNKIKELAAEAEAEIGTLTDEAKAEADSLIAKAEDRIEKAEWLLGGTSSDAAETATADGTDAFDTAVAKLPEVTSDANPDAEAAQPEATAPENVEETVADANAEAAPEATTDETAPAVEPEATETGGDVAGEPTLADAPPAEATSQTEPGSTDGTGTTGDGTETATA